LTDYAKHSLPAGDIDPEQVLTGERRQFFDLLHQADDLQRRGDSDFQTVLSDLNKLNLTTVTGAQYAGITIINGPEVSTLGATHQHPTTLDRIQADTGEGPCLSAAWQQHIIAINDLAGEDRWPGYREAAMRLTPIRSILSFRLFGTSRYFGALNFYADEPAVFDDDSVEQGLVVATHTTVLWNSIRREQDFQSALASRDIIGQAKGIIMERFGVDAVAAFELLRKLSQENNVKLVDVASRLIAVDRSDS